jgi:hypothetical protein
MKLKDGDIVVTTNNVAPGLRGQVGVITRVFTKCFNYKRTVPEFHSIYVVKHFSGDSGIREQDQMYHWDSTKEYLRLATKLEKVLK